MCSVGENLSLGLLLLCLLLGFHSKLDIACLWLIAMLFLIISAFLIILLLLFLMLGIGVAAQDELCYLLLLPLWPILESWWHGTAVLPTAWSATIEAALLLLLHKGGTIWLVALCIVVLVSNGLIIGEDCDCLVNRLGVLVICHSKCVS